ncbi:hypothetical protein [Rhodoferax sp.]|uniref:hypothetical protein n=1 Tax=Rhodoferax sp. TaxID=50421 RepID=UPI00374DBA46
MPQTSTLDYDRATIDSRSARTAATAKTPGAERAPSPRPSTGSSRFSPADFSKWLKEGGTVAPVTLTGLVKESDTSDDTLMFSMNGCASWTAIPHSLIDQVELLRYVACKDHQHALATLYFKPSDHTEVRAALSLLASIPKNAQPPSAEGSAHWFWWLQSGYEECASCLNDCGAIADPQQRRACIARCC